MRVRTWTRAVVPVTAAGVALLVGCTSDAADGDGFDPDDGGVDVVVPAVTPPPSRSTPFCRAMLDLDERLPADPAVDATEQILAAYRDAEQLAPPEIAVEFGAVIRGLETGTAVTLPPASTASPAAEGAGGDAVPITDDTFFEEGYLPDDNPASRVNEYIDFACRGVQNNPGPPPTQPGVPPSTADR